MSPKGETRIALIAAAVMLAIILLSLCGCKTKTVLQTEVVMVHDTLITHHTDTIRDVKVTTKTDTVKQIEMHTYTLNNVGDTVKEIHHYHDVWHTMVVDSTDRYKAVVDSLRKALSEQQSKEKIETKTKYLIRWWEYVVLFSVVGIILFFVWKRGGRTFIDRL